MALLNAWVLFGLIPLYLIYKKEVHPHKQKKLLYLSLVFMFFAMARPAYENAYVEQNFNSHDYIIAIYASYSMQAQDLKPSRYELAKLAIKKLIKEHPQDRFTLFAFTSSTLLISPPTTDTEISMMALDALNPKYILTKSTNLKNLFKTVAKLPIKQKNLIIFSDGGDEHSVETLVKIAKKATIIPYIVATATQKGAALKKGKKYIKDAHDSIVISRINPMLIDLSNDTGGKYYELNSLNDINKLSSDLQTQQTQKEHIQVKTYKELFYIPLFIAIVLYISSITRIAQRFLVFLPLFLFIPNQSRANLLDFHYLQSANQSYKEHKYNNAVTAFKKVSRSPQSYYNIATTYYKEGAYKKAVSYYMQIRSRDKELKQKLFYNLGNCAVKLKEYDRAKKYYIYALALGEDKDALYNLTLLRKLHLKSAKDVSKMLPKNQQTSKKKDSKRSSNKKKSSGKKGSNRSGNSQSNGSGANKKTKGNKSIKSRSKKQKGAYKFTYKAYEKINKGYTDEKEPW